MLAFAMQPKLTEELFSSQIAENTYEILPDSNITQLVSRLKNISHYSHIIIDIDIFSQSEDELIKSLFLLNSINATPLIVLARGKLRGDPLLAKLVELKIYNFVNAVDIGTAKKQIADCFVGRTYDDVADYVETSVTKEKKNWFSKFTGKDTQKQTLHIALAGVIGRMGTTTQALRLVRYFEMLGKACYVEVNNSVHVSIMAHVFSDTKDLGGHYELHNVRLYPNNSDVDTVNYDFVISDCGCNTECTEFQSADIKITVTGSAAWEMSQLAKTMAELNDNSVKYIFVFTGKEEQSDILEFMGERWINTCFAENITDMFCELTTNEKDIYQKLFKERGKLK